MAFKIIISSMDPFLSDQIETLISIGDTGYLDKVLAR